MLIVVKNYRKNIDIIFPNIYLKDVLRQAGVMKKIRILPFPLSLFLVRLKTRKRQRFLFLRSGVRKKLTNGEKNWMSALSDLI